jgi:hypothetical protein
MSTPDSGTMPIERITRMVSPPANPTELKSIEDWKTAESDFGFPLPSDYRDFVFTYGSGLFARFYRVYNPFSASKFISLSQSVTRVTDGLRKLKSEFPDLVPYPIHPEPQGLFPWGNDENGNDYYWLTNGRSNDWRVISDEVRGEGFREHNCTMTEFLEKILLRKIDALAGGYPQADDFVFKSFTSFD